MMGEKSVVIEHGVETGTEDSFLAAVVDAARNSRAMHVSDARPMTDFRAGEAVADETYDEKRARKLEEMLRALAAHIATLDANGRLLTNAGELLKLIGDVRSELFHYEVRITYDTPEVAEHRRLIEEAKRSEESSWEPTTWSPDDDEEKEW